MIVEKLKDKNAGKISGGCPKQYTESRGVVTLCARCARAHPLFGSDKCKDLCGHTHFLLRNVPEKDFLKILMFSS